WSTTALQAGSRSRAQRMSCWPTTSSASSAGRSRSRGRATSRPGISSAAGRSPMNGLAKHRDGLPLSWRSGEFPEPPNHLPAPDGGCVVRARWGLRGGDLEAQVVDDGRHPAPEDEEGAREYKPPSELDAKEEG